MSVLDASAALELLLGAPAAEAIARRIAPPDETLHAPHLIDLEVAQVLRRYRRQGALDDARALAALRDLSNLGIERYPHDALLGRIWQLRDTAAACDAAYLALAEALAAPLLTADTHLAASRGHRALIELVGSA